jgi:hypothetical protein
LRGAGAATFFTGRPRLVGAGSGSVALVLGGGGSATAGATSAAAGAVSGGGGAADSGGAAGGGATGSAAAVALALVVDTAGFSVPVVNFKTAIAATASTATTPSISGSLLPRCRDGG